MEAKIGHNLSYTWRSIWISQFLLKEGYKWRIGKGGRISLWNGKWLGEGELLQCLITFLMRKNSIFKKLYDNSIQNWRYFFGILNYLLTAKNVFIYLSNYLLAWLGVIGSYYQQTQIHKQSMFIDEGDDSKYVSSSQYKTICKQIAFTKINTQKRNNNLQQVKNNILNWIRTRN